LRKRCIKQRYHLLSSLHILTMTNFSHPACIPLDPAVSARQPPQPRVCCLRVVSLMSYSASRIGLMRLWGVFVAGAVGARIASRSLSVVSIPSAPPAYVNDRKYESLSNLAERDMCAPLRPGSVDVLLFNPPYVPTEDLPRLPSAAENVKCLRRRLLLCLNGCRCGFPRCDASIAVHISA
jgi:hypothetical protein